MKKLLYRVLSVLFAICIPFSALAEIPSANPILNPTEAGEYIKPQQEFMNILLLGIDYGTTDYWGSGKKRTFEDCHTDAVMVASINLTNNTMTLVSLPRDSIVYVPGVYGAYKLNSAINCCDNTDDGLRHICDCASWLLGGIEIHRYCAVDMNAIIALGDAIGGVDFELEMSYKGHSGKAYKKGKQHLDGTGIMDYLRARRNATTNGNDIGRTNRQRELISAIIQKVIKEPSCIASVMGVLFSNDGNILTNISIGDMMDLSGFLLRFDPNSIGSKVLSGPYRTSLGGWNFTFIDQENRIAVLKEVYGIDAEPLPFVDFAYTKWLYNTGFTAVRQLKLADELDLYARENGFDHTAAYTQFQEAYLAAVTAFDTAAEHPDGSENKPLKNALGSLKEAGNQLAQEMGYPKELHWNSDKLWYRDPMIVQYPEINWH